MIICKVTGTVVSTRKSDKLTGSKFMVVDPVYNKGEKFVAVDAIGAGIGETVLVTTSGAARTEMPDHPLDALIVGIIDEGSFEP